MLDSIANSNLTFICKSTAMALSLDAAAGPRPARAWSMQKLCSRGAAILGTWIRLAVWMEENGIYHIISS